MKSHSFRSETSVQADWRSGLVAYNKLYRNKCRMCQYTPEYIFYCDDLAFESVSISRTLFSLPFHCVFVFLWLVLSCLVLLCRREKETNDLRQVLQERERQLRDLADELGQLEKTHQVRLEALAAEKASLEEEFEVITQHRQGGRCN